MKKILSFLILLLFLIHAVHAQITNAPLTNPTPNAAELGRFGNTAVSLYQGIASIRVPIKEIPFKNVRLPIDLSYNTNGVRPDIHPGWVGSNWSLSCGGGITRVVNRGPDELDTYWFPRRGFFFCHDSISGSTWADSNSIKKWADRSYEDFQIQGNPSSHWYDTEPDEFIFSFLGYYGKFFLDHNGNFNVQCDKRLKVIFDTADFIQPFIYGRSTPNYVAGYIYKTFGKFTIIDPYGTQYIFGTANGIEYSDNMLGMTTVPVFGTVPQRGGLFTATSWLLKQIISHDGIELANFTYTRGAFICAAYTMPYREETYVGGTAVSCGIYIGVKVLSPLYLTEVSLPLNAMKVKFTLSRSHELFWNKGILYVANGWPSSGEGGTSEDIGKFADILNDTTGLYFFGESIPSASSISSKLDRLIWGKLDKIEFIDTINNEVNQTVLFNYTDTSAKRLFLNEIKFKDKLLSEISTYKFTYDTTSLPGYCTQYNDHGGYYNGQALPSSAVDTSYNPDFAVKKATDSTLIKAGILTKLEYPTGGSTEFKYEAHDYNKAVKADRTDVMDVTRTYIGGLRVKEITDKDGAGNSVARKYYYVRNYSNDSVLSQLSSSGVISAVPRYIIETSNAVTDIGTTFSYMHKSAIPVVPLTSSDNENYVTYSEIVEKEQNNGYTITYYSNHDNGHRDIAPLDTLNSSKIFYLKGTNMDLERGKPYKICVYRDDDEKLKETAIEYVVVGDSSTQYSRMVFGQKKRILTNPGGWVYGGSSHKLYYYAYFPKKITDTVYSGSTKIYSSNEFEYDNENKVAISQQIIKSNLDTVLNQYQYPFNFDASGNVYEKMVQKNMVDYRIEEKNFLLKNGSDYITGGSIGNYKEFASGKIYPDSIFVFRTNQPVVSGSVSNTQFSGHLVFDNRYKHELEYRDYNSKGNLLETSGKQSGIISYVWDYGANYLIAKVINAVSTDIAYTSFEANGYGYWDFSGTPVSDATSPTGNKCYYLSDTTTLSSINDLSQSTTYIVSYWSKNGAYTVSGYSYVRQGPAINGWTYYEHEITNRDNISFSGTGYIDEVRLYPKGALMTTYTHSPAIGISSQCDATNKITYYEYDNFGRLKLIKDRDKNVVKVFDYQYKQSQNQ